MPFVVTPSSAVTPEGFVLNGLDLNSATGIYQLEDVQLPPPKKVPEWASGGPDVDGDVLVRTPRFENRTITAKVRVVQTTMDGALAAVAAISDAIEEASKQPDGVTLVWTPASGTHSLTFYVLHGEVTDLPLDPASGYMAYAPVVTLVLTCKPFGYGPEVTGATVSGTTAVLTQVISSVAGDVPAEARLIVTDLATQNRRFVEWGLESRYLNQTTSLDVLAGSLVTTGFSGVAATRTGAYSTGAAVVRGNLTVAPLAICGLGNLSHVGQFRIKARCYPVIATGVLTDLKVRLNWKSGDSALNANAWDAPVATGTFVEVDLGVVNVAPASLGTQRWTGQIEASSSTAGDTLDIDHVVLVPAGEGYGKARAPAVLEIVTAFTAWDEFDQTAGVLTTKAPPVGSAWTGAGSANDFNVVAGTVHNAQRSVTTDADVNTGRYEVTTANQTDTLVQADVMYPTGFTGGAVRCGVLARYQDVNNWLRAALYKSATASSLYLEVRVAGVVSVLGTAPYAGASATIRLVVDASGYVSVWAYLPGTTQIAPLITAANTVLNGSGTLSTGKGGIYDAWASAPAAGGARTYDNFFAAVPIGQAALFSGRNLEIRSDSAQRQDSTGTYYGPVPVYRGSRFYLPQAGSANRSSRILVKADRNDIEAFEDVPTGDNLQWQCRWTSRYVVAPH